MKISGQRIAWVLVLLGLAALLAMKFYAQRRHIEIYVSRSAQMPAELATRLHMDEHRIDPAIRIESPYESAEDKILSMEEVGKIRSRLAWSKRTPILVDALIIHSTNRVSTRRTTSRYLEECEIVKENDEWAVKSGTRTDLTNVTTIK